MLKDSTVEYVSMATLNVDQHTLPMKHASESVMVMDQYEALTARLDDQNVKLNLLQSSILELTKRVNLLVASEMKKKNPKGYGDYDKTTMCEEDDEAINAIISSGETHESDSKNTVDTSSFSELPTEIESHESFIRNLLEEIRSLHTGVFTMEDVVLDDADYVPLATLDDQDDVMKRYASFKKFDTVMDHSDHLFSQRSSLLNQPPNADWAEMIKKERKILEQDLPETIFVRAYESRMDLLRAVIIGPKGTPYHDGLFFFDVCFPSSYPDSPPLLLYRSGGLVMNPNLLMSGKVCLSLPKTTGDIEQLWVPGTSTILQLLVSIQSLILNKDPLFNDTIYMDRCSVFKEHASLLYNENTFIKSLKTMVYVMNKPPKSFEDLIVGHFRNHVSDIVMACKAYMEGLQVGCPVSGLQQVGKKGSCSITFKNELASCIKTLATAFYKIGANPVSLFMAMW